MTDNGQDLRGGVILGGRQRTVTLSKNDDAILTVMAKMNKTSPMTMLEYIVSQGISDAWQSTMASKLIFVCANWVTWAT